MKKLNKTSVLFLGFSIMTCLFSCSNPEKTTANKYEKTTSDSLQDYVDTRLAIYEKVKLTTNLNVLTASERKVLPLLIEAAKIMDVIYAAELQKASSLLKQAALLTDDVSFKKYLNLRADALVTDNYKASDYAWLDMKTNGLDIIIGPIENYEDKLFNARAAFQSYVLIKDKVWSKRLAKYVAMLPELQRGLPVEEKYKKEVPGTDSELNAYDVVYYAGDCNNC